MTSKRNYHKETSQMYGYGPASSVTPYQRANRKRKANRNRARQLLKKQGVKVAGKDVDHKNGNALDNRRSNLQAISVARNRAKNKK